MIVVADSGPLHYLILLGHVDLLRRFYGEVLVPEAVARELSVGSTPDVVRDWIAAAPSWVDVRPLAPEAVAAITEDLDLGERAAIALAETVHADLLFNRRGGWPCRGATPTPASDWHPWRTQNRCRTWTGERP